VGCETSGFAESRAEIESAEPQERGQLIQANVPVEVFFQVGVNFPHLPFSQSPAWSLWGHAGARGMLAEQVKTQNIDGLFDDQPGEGGDVGRLASQQLEELTGCGIVASHAVQQLDPTFSINRLGARQKTSVGEIDMRDLEGTTDILPGLVTARDEIIAPGRVNDCRRRRPSRHSIRCGLP